MMKLKTKVRAKQDIQHGLFCNNPECVPDATEIVAGETGVVIDTYRLGFLVQLDENENCWWFDTNQAELWEVLN